MKCPECGAPCDRDEVDIGVGVQCGPWGCYDCGWTEGVTVREEENAALDEAFKALVTFEPEPDGD